MGNSRPKWLILPAVIILSALLIGLLPVNAQSPEAKDDALIWGYVIDQGLPSNASKIIVTREHYIGNESFVNDTGYYSMELPSGNYYQIKIMSTQGRLFYVYEFNISSGQSLRLDFDIDSKNVAQSRLYGRVTERLTQTPLEDVKITLTRLDEISPAFSDFTNGNGDYSIRAPAGVYYLCATLEDKVIHSQKVEVEWNLDKKVDMKVSNPSREFTIENFLKILTEKWLFIIFIVVTIIAGSILLFYIARFFDNLEERLEEKHRRFIDEAAVVFIDKYVRGVIVVAMGVIIAYLSAKVFDAERVMWDPIKGAIYSLIVIAVLIMLLRLSLMILTQFTAYLRRSRGVGKKTLLSPRLFTVLEMIGKYVLIIMFGLAIVLIALGEVGMTDLINKGLTGSLEDNAQHIIFVIILLFIAIIATRFSKALFEDWKSSQSKFQPEMIDVASKGVNLFIIGMILMIIIFTVLSAVGLGDVGQTIIIVSSMIVGLVVSMAATGSIGNMLSGLVLISFKPITDGDFVRIGDKHLGTVHEMNLMFTKIIDLEGRLISIPNNFVLAHGITNWTKAKDKGSFAIEIDVTIGYDIPIKKTIHMLEKGAVVHDEVLHDPAPFGIATDFQDHAIAYKLRAYVRKPEAQFRIKSEVMANIQESFAEEGMEILSPLQVVDRRINATTIEEKRKFHKNVVDAQTSADPKRQKKGVKYDVGEGKLRDV